MQGLVAKAATLLLFLQLNYKQKLKIKWKQLLCVHFKMNNGEDDIFEVKSDETIFNQIKKDSGLKREQQTETEHKLYIRTMW